jgi:hypothetical protein
MSGDKQKWSTLTGSIAILKSSGFGSGSVQRYRDKITEFIKHNDAGMLKASIDLGKATGPETVAVLITQLPFAAITAAPESNPMRLLRELYEGRISGLTSKRQPEGATVSPPVNKPSEQPSKSSKPPVVNNTPAPVKPSPVVVTNTPETTGSGEYGWPEKFNKRPQNSSAVVTQRKKDIKKFLEEHARGVLSKTIEIPQPDGNSEIVTVESVLTTNDYQNNNAWNASDAGQIANVIKEFYVEYKKDAMAQEAKAVLDNTSNRLAEEPVAWTTMDNLFKSVDMEPSSNLAVRKKAVRKFLEKNDPLMLQKKVKYSNKEPTVSELLDPEQYPTISLAANGMAYEILHVMYNERLEKYLNGDPTRGDSDKEPALPPTTATTTTTREVWDNAGDIHYPSDPSVGPRQDAIRAFLRRNDPVMLDKGWIQHDGDKIMIALLLSGTFNDSTLFRAKDGWVYITIHKEYERRRQEFEKTDRNEPYKTIETDGSTTNETPKNNTNDQPVESDSDDESVDQEDEPAQGSSEPGAFQKIVGGIAGGGGAIVSGALSLTKSVLVSSQSVINSLAGRTDGNGEPLISPEVLSDAKSAQESFEELQREAATLREANTRLKKAVEESTERERLAAERHANEIQRIKNDGNKTDGAVLDLNATLEKQQKAMAEMERKHNEVMAAKEQERTDALDSKNEIKKSWDLLNQQILAANQREQARNLEKKKLEKELNETREELQAKKGSNGNESDEMRQLREQYHTNMREHDSKIREFEENANGDKKKLEEVNESLEKLRKEHSELAEKYRTQASLLEEAAGSTARLNEVITDKNQSFEKLAGELAQSQASVKQQREVNRGLEIRIKEQNEKNTRLTTDKIDAESREEVLKQELETTNLLIAEYTKQLAQMTPINTEKAIERVAELAKLEEGVEKAVLQEKAKLLQQRLNDIGVYHLDGDVPTIEKRGAMQNGVGYFALNAEDFAKIMRHWAHYRLLQIERNGKTRNFYELIEQHKNGYANPNGELYNAKGKFYYTVLSEEHRKRLLDELDNGASRDAGTGYDSFKTTSRALTLTDHVQQLQLSALPLDAPGSERVTVTFNDSDGYPMLGFVASGLPVQYVEGRGALLVIDMEANWANLAYTHATHMGRTIIDSHGTMVVEHGDLKDTYFLDIAAPPVTALEYAYGQESLVTVASADDTRVSLLVSYVTATLSSLKRLMIPVHSNALPAAPRAGAPSEEEEEEDIDISNEKQHVSMEEGDEIHQPPPEKDKEEQRKREEEEEEEERRHEESMRAAEERESQVRGREEGSTSDASSTSTKAQASFDAYQDVDTDDESVFDAISEWK